MITHYTYHRVINPEEPDYVHYDIYRRDDKRAYLICSCKEEIEAKTLTNLLAQEIEAYTQRIICNIFGGDISGRF